MKIFKFSIVSRGNGYIEGNQSAELIIMVVFPLLSLKKGQVSLYCKGIKAASLGKGQLCNYKWRLEVVSFNSLCATS